MKFVLVIVCVLGAQLALGTICPGAQMTCPGDMTCCQLPSGKEGCCPFQNATCCPDKIHCCPDGNVCHPEGYCQFLDGTVSQKLTQLLMNYKEAENQLSDDYQNVNASITDNCPDGTPCTDNQTCCSVGYGKFMCCPMLNGVCCKNLQLQACCPQGYTCDDNLDICHPEGDGNNSLLHVKASRVNTICPGGQQTCPAGDTCCPKGRGSYACCPLLAATCCSDQRTCCPHGYRCDGRGHCIQ